MHNITALLFLFCMSNDKEFFATPEFRKLLERYEHKSTGSSPYFEIDELDDLLSYYLYNDNIQRVNEVYTLASQLYPNSCEVVKMQIRILLTYGKPKEALEAFENIKHETDVDTSLLKAEVLLALKEFNRACVIARKILEENNTTDEAAYDAMEILLDSGFAQEVFDIVSNELRNHPGNRNLLEIMAECLIELQKIDEAIELYNKLLDKNPYSTFYWEQLGHIYYLIERYSKALECYEYELTIDSTIEYASIMQGYCYYHLRDYGKSLEIFGNLSRKYPKNLQARFFTALSLANKREELSAIKEYEQVILSVQEKGDKELELALILSLVNISLIWKRRGDEELARSCMRHAINNYHNVSGIEQLLFDTGSSCELRDKENKTFREINLTLIMGEWNEHEIMQEFALRLIKMGYTSLALYPLYKARKSAPDTAEIDACIAYSLYHEKGDIKEICNMITSALDGKSDKLFSLFDIPYKSDMDTSEFIERAFNR